MTNKPMIYIDMDGVLADLDGGVFDCFGEYPSEMSAESIKHFYREILPAYTKLNMFELQPTLKESQILILALNMLKKEGKVNLAICTSTGHFYRPLSEVRHQKGKFIEQHFTSLKDIPFITTSSGIEKSFMAHERAFLIDDHHKNITRFIEAGGSGYIYDADDAKCVTKTINAINLWLDRISLYK